MAIAALQRGAAVLVYPGEPEDLWRPHSMRHQIYFAGRKGFIKLALREGVPIVPAISKGAHDTLIILADFYNQLRQLHEWGMPWLLGFDPMVFPIYLGLPWGWQSDLYLTFLYLYQFIHVFVNLLCLNVMVVRQQAIATMSMLVMKRSVTKCKQNSTV